MNPDYLKQLNPKLDNPSGNNINFENAKVRQSPSTNIQPEQTYESDVLITTTKRSSLKIPLLLFTLLFLLLVISGLTLVFLQKINNRNNTNITPTPTSTDFIINSQELMNESIDLQNLNPINDGQIFLVEQGIFYTLDTTTMQKTYLKLNDLLAKDDYDFPDEYVFSTNGKFLFFSYLQDLGVYDFENESLNMIDLNSDLGGSIWDQSFLSTNNIYVILDVGCCPGDRGRTLVNIEKGKIIAELTGQGFSWATDGSKFILEAENQELYVIPADPPLTNNSLYLFEIKNDHVSKRELIKANLEQGYKILEWINPDKFIYKQLKYTEPFNHTTDPTQKGFFALPGDDKWIKIYENPVITFWEMDILTDKTTQLQNYREKEYDYTSYSPSKEWKVFLEGEQYPKDIFISKIDGSNKVRISNGSEAIWRP
ncbi:MAG: hypothetical protein US60_C0014G0014 [Microgenomates group bacterium GW2011_GWC1_37_8]|uniref:Uncharacterized protein n=1 Tax=Candidatus Woesebacteria bacterium GW2011_GWB1_38_8 TaxID=1618570 RepID=A0A0G0L074_9BACT|nr:MAG: hypothetical protein US60_C0014G0014 [Microgenomates group bacterium GW2011_GWC1_37_8]KKQ84407.1 MAG: hypothetical protein UT08_C0018G0013 [Candidatus Woesebacteria bacterium GW2011_GWB1_38_8]